MEVGGFYMSANLKTVISWLHAANEINYCKRNVRSLEERISVAEKERERFAQALVKAVGNSTAYFVVSDRIVVVASGTITVNRAEVEVAAEKAADVC